MRYKCIIYVTSLKAVICFCILFTNLHCITRLSNTKQQISIKPLFLHLNTFLMRGPPLLTGCIPSCFHWWRRSLCHPASVHAGESEQVEYDGLNRKLLSQIVVEAKTASRTNLSKQLFINGEPQIQVRWVVLQNPHQGVEIFTVLKRQQTKFTKWMSSRLAVIWRTRL